MWPWVAIAAVFALVAYASKARAPTRGPDAPTWVDPSDGSNGSAGSALVTAATSVIGTPYLWGGDDPTVGLDCAGLVKWAYKEVTGNDLPWDYATGVDALNASSSPVNPSDIAPGDLLYYSYDGTSLAHVAIYAGKGKMIEAEGSRYNPYSVALTPVRSQYLVSVGRL